MQAARAFPRTIVTGITNTTRVSCFLPLLLATALLISFSTSALSGPPNERTGWMAGVGFLLGNGDIESSRGFDNGWVSGVTPQFRFGYMVAEERLMLSFENKQWTREKGNLPTAELPPDVDFIKYQIGSQIYSLALTAFPGNPESLWGGFYLNAGAGPAVARLDSALVDTLYSGEDPEEVVRYDWGWGYYLGGGYEYRFVKNVAAGLSVNYVYSSIKGEYIDRTKIWTLAFNLMWYF